MPQKIGFLSPLATNQADERVIYPTGTPAGVFTAGELLGKDLIEQAVSALDIRYAHDRDGDPYAIFRVAGDTLNLDLHSWFLLVGPNLDIFKFFAKVHPPILPENFPEALISCNEYNRFFRFGRAFLHRAEHESAPYLHLQGQVLLSDGTTQGFLEDYIGSHLDCFREFLSQPSTQNLFFLTPPKTRRKSNGKANGKDRKGGAAKPK